MYITASLLLTHSHLGTQTPTNTICQSLSLILNLVLVLSALAIPITVPLTSSHAHLGSPTHTHTHTHTRTHTVARTNWYKFGSCTTKIYKPAWSPKKLNRDVLHFGILTSRPKVIESFSTSEPGDLVDNFLTKEHTISNKKNSMENPPRLGFGGPGNKFKFY